MPGTPMAKRSLDKTSPSQEGPPAVCSMRTGKQLIHATRPFAQDHSGRSWWYLSSTAFLLAAAVLGSLWNLHLALRLACSVLSGLLLLRFFVIYHDQQHHAILPRSHLAEVLMRIFGILVLS